MQQQKGQWPQHQQQEEAMEAHHSLKAGKRRKKRRRSSADQNSPSSPPQTLHVGVDRANSNWQKLQIALKKARPVGKPQNLAGNKLDEAKLVGKTEHEAASNLQKSLSPRNDDHSLTKVLAIDCEMVGAGMDGKRSILARVSLVNIWGNVIYDKHVKPMERVTDYRTKVSGVRAHNLKNGESFAVAQKEVAELIQGRVLVGHSLRNDLKVLYLSHPKKDTRDVAVYPPLRSLNGRPRSLRHIASELLGVQIQAGEHCSVEDARAAMYIYQQLKREWEASVSRKQ